MAPPIGKPLRKIRTVWNVLQLMTETTSSPLKKAIPAALIGQA
jgi:hypothetical protein